MEQANRKEIGLGSAKELSLNRARDKAAALWVNAKRTETPPREELAVPKRLVGEQYVELNASLWKHAKSVSQWRYRLEAWAKPIFDLPVVQVTTPDVVQCLRSIWISRASTVHRLLIASSRKTKGQS